MDSTASHAAHPAAHTARIVWRVAMLAAVLWVGWELNALRGELNAPQPSSIGLAQQVADVKTELDEVADAVADLQDAVDRVEAALVEDAEADPAVRREAALQQRVLQPARRHAGAAAPSATRVVHQPANTASSSAIQRRLSASPAKLASKLLRAST
ncbi:hypothetical protein [Ideonella sp. BN130291]|uniref:hypothetical protein n=1 Tax=Ideonella sp. BN130291 TaxID=3112940 RepID=UPI002E25817F|nr:hypothetical protein [Ideonella sp. BN130291]